MDYTRFMNSVSINRTMSPLRRLYDLQKLAGPKMISLGAGIPNPDSFPFESMTIRTKSDLAYTLEDEELKTALGYMDSAGMPCLIDWLIELQKQLHDPPYARNQSDLNQLIIVPGSEDGMSKVLEMVLEPSDPVLIVEPAYPGLLAILRPIRCEMLAIQSDQDGARPDSLKEWLEKYQQKERRPRIMVIQPSYCNPTGVSTTLERRKEIYKLACDHDILILEDDPYYLLTFDTDQQLIPSFLALDTEGRVLRLESFSKILSAGMRIGTLSGPRPLVQRVVTHISSHCIQASTFSQAILYRFLTEYGHNGYLDHAKSAASLYKNRCNLMLEVAEKYLSGIAEWYRPNGGMFLWIKMLDIEDTEKMVMERSIENMLLLAPGSFFMCDDEKPTSYLRASFSWANDEEMNEGFRRLVQMANQMKRKYSIMNGILRNA